MKRWKDESRDPQVFELSETDDIVSERYFEDIHKKLPADHAQSFVARYLAHCELVRDSQKSGRCHA